MMPNPSKLKLKLKLVCAGLMVWFTERVKVQQSQGESNLTAPRTPINLLVLMYRLNLHSTEYYP